jgi:regulator of sirC expression with transglutaminase-like and TPR domain
MALPEEAIPLDEAALLIAASGNRGLDVARELRRLDELAASLEPGTDATAVCRLLFGTLKLRGDLRHYDDPRNSYLHLVLRRRLGIPITLSVLLMEIGRRWSLGLEGVGMPGHFLVRDPTQPDLFIDAFSGGRRLDEAACMRLMAASPGDIPPGALDPVGTRTIVARMLANLDRSFRRRLDQGGVRWVTRMRSAIPGLPLPDRVSIAESLSSLGYHDEAATFLEELAGGADVPPEVAQALRARVTGLMARLN